jgi:GNAT superfamily N-acetyltransferase
MTDFSIRNATPEDVDAIHTMILELAEYEKLLDIVAATADDLRNALFGERAVIEAFIAECEDKPAGYAIFFHNYSTFVGRPGIYLEDLYVRPENRGKGIGTKFLARLAQLAQERNCGRVEWCVLDWNTPSIEFYKNLGAKMMDEWNICRLNKDAIAKIAAM